MDTSQMTTFDLQSERNKLVLFVARVSVTGRQGSKERLQDSLLSTRKKYVMTYGPLSDESLALPFLIFMQGSNRALGLEPRRALTRAFERARELGCPLVLAINGWDGLSTNQVALTSLFGSVVGDIEIMMRIFAEDPRRFYQVSVSHVVKVFAGEVDEEEGTLPFSTGEFIARVRAIALDKARISLDFKKLREQSQNRNTDPDAIDVVGFACEKCDVVFDWRKDLTVHMHHMHEDNEERSKCQYCDETFTRLDSRDRHEKNACTKRPGYTSEPKKKRARRGDRETQADRHTQEARETMSEGGLIPYYLLEGPAGFPRVDPMAPFEERIVYKKEIWCRYPDCDSEHKFSEPTRLRTHYKGQHKFQYPACAPGKLNQRHERVQAQGLTWLATCAQVGEANAGPQPVPVRTGKAKAVPKPMQAPGASSEAGDLDAGDIH